ncbi:hypothetical protein AG1IA_03092 [Rhizoctonia solani AG-1 IA]|uniref:Uncharacterized protein n=1 Tax=Thanatephorus cucumeris (strain AG1-IA) TaxID=983506 RepID=L8WY05_THACA|nr:hypothetical protein AG1IA_03092 [Rhizoctonia solani AG-1 IA]
MSGFLKRRYQSPLSHVPLAFCPDTAEYRDILTNASPEHIGREVFGTLPGLTAIAEFISKSGIGRLGGSPASAQPP